MDLDSFKNRCQAFIFNWPRVTDNAKKLQEKFTNLGIETYVINSDEAENENGLENWVHIGDSGYMIQQYAKALELFNKDYFVELFADVYDVDAELIIERACYTYTTYHCGIYAPNVDWNFWNFELNKIPRLEENLYEVKNAESLLSIIHKDVLERVYLDTEKYQIGWGIDFLMAILAHMQGKMVIRDYITTITHPKGTGYNTERARQEYKDFIADQDDDINVRFQPWIDATHRRLKSRRTNFEKILLIDVDFKKPFFEQLDMLINQLIYCEEFEYLPLVRGVGDRVRGDWLDCFGPVLNLEYNQILKKIYDAKSELNRQHLIQLSSDEISKLDAKECSSFLASAPPVDLTDAEKPRWLKGQRSRAYHYINKYLRLNPFIRRTLNELHQTYFTGPVIGVCLSTERDKGSLLSEAFSKIDDFLDENPEGKVLVSVESDAFFEQISNQYQGQVICISGLALNPAQNSLLDCLLLSRCSTLIKGDSKAAEYALYINKELVSVDLRAPE